ncbi:paraquat-inducible protein A [Vibrio sp.]|nr:paraquat-inducible protein A [Vibrio sp.]
MNQLVKTSPSGADFNCPTCGLQLTRAAIPSGTKAQCPRCNTNLYRADYPSLSGNMVLLISCLMLCIPAYSLNFLTIHLIGMKISASFFTMLIALYDSGFGLLSLLIALCGFLAPTGFCISLFIQHYAISQHNVGLYHRMEKLTAHLRPWVMIDVFLLSVAIACVRLKDFAEIDVPTGLYIFIVLQVLTIMLVIRSNSKAYEHHLRERSPVFFHQLTTLRVDKKRDTHLSSILLLCAAICFVPANFIPISILMSNGNRTVDTIFSGVEYLMVNGLGGLAVIIFIASIAVPMLKILGLGYLIASCRWGSGQLNTQNTKVYFFLKWIGKWSMIDLFVIAITLTLVDRGQLLDFVPGYGAIAFAAVVVFTMLATESFSPQLIWQNDNSRQVNE